MEMELISRETIKPSTPTSPHLTTYPLCFIDNIVFRNYVPLLLFYSPNPNDQTLITSKISRLKKSLSQVLSLYYPFSGTLRDQVSIECNDQGVPLLVTRFTCQISWILNNPTQASLKPLFPDALQWKPLSSSLLVIQINIFACGGIAISVCMCHKIADACTLSNFINDWARFNRQQQQEEEGGEFTLLPSPVPGALFLPRENLPLFPESTFVEENNIVCRRFVFEASKIDSLKAIVSSHNVPNPTRVQVVSALIYKRAVATLGLSFKTTSFRTAVNLRKRTVPALPEKSVGNLVWFLFVLNPETELHELALKMKEGLTDFCDTYAKKFCGKEKDLFFISECLKQATRVPEPGGSDEESESQSFIYYASWCKFPMYDADFGWGNPVWFTTTMCPVRNSVVLMDTNDGSGIEALVNMEAKDMARFEIDEEILQYACLNPAVGTGN